MRTANVEKDANARLYASAKGFWVRGQKVFCDIRVFNPLAKSNRVKSLVKIHQSHENEKKRKYAQRVLEVEHGTVTHLVFSCFGGMGKECHEFYQRLDEILVDKRKISQCQRCNMLHEDID